MSDCGTTANHETDSLCHERPLNAAHLFTHYDIELELFLDGEAPVRVCFSPCLLMRQTGADKVSEASGQMRKTTIYTGA